MNTDLFDEFYEHLATLGRTFEFEGEYEMWLELKVYELRALLEGMKQ